MALENLTEKLSSIFKNLRAKGKLSESDVKNAAREIRLVLLEADVNYKVAKEFTDNIAQKAVGEQVLESLTPGQMVVKIVNEELIKLMGESENKLSKAPKPPSIVMMCGLQGCGKTTHAAKIANMLKKRGSRPLLVACDIYRPAAIEQLKILAETIQVPVFEMGQNNPVDTAKRSVIHAKDHGNDFVLIDTAGRLHIDDDLMAELQQMKEAVIPNEILLAVDAMTGQDAVNVAKSFDEKLGVTGIVLTKMDGDTRGGAALSVKAVTGKPIKFVGTGEKLEDLEVFHPNRMASRILGMGDVLSLIEEAESKLDIKAAEQMAKKLKENQFDLEDFANQIVQIKKLGPIKSIISKLPGIGSKLDSVDFDEKIVDRNLAMIRSMTPKERAKPSIINMSRKKRIAMGSGVKVEEVNKLLRGFEQISKTMKQFNGIKKKRFPMFGLKKLMK